MSDGETLSIDPHALLDDLYRTLLHRDVDDAGRAHYGAMLRDPGGVARAIAGICESPEFAAWHRVGLPAPRAEVDAPRIPLARPIVVVDLGAQRLGHEGHVYSELGRRGYAVEVIGFEPLSHRIAERQAAEGRERLTLFPHFVGDGAEHTFHINAYDATSSLLPINRGLVDDFVNLDQLRTVRTERVRTHALDALLGADRPVDFLKIDIQGFELEALRHADETLKRTLVVHCEVAFDYIYENQCLFSDIDSFLRERNFEFIDLVHPHRASYLGSTGSDSGDRLLWADAVFFKRASALEVGQRAVQAAIARHVYDKPGLAERLLTVASPRSERPR